MRRRFRCGRKEDGNRWRATEKEKRGGEKLAYTALYCVQSRECTCQWSSFNSFIDPRINWDAVILTLATRYTSRAIRRPGTHVQLASILTGTARRGRGLMRHADWLRRFIGWLTLINFYPGLFAYNWRAPPVA